MMIPQDLHEEQLKMVRLRWRVDLISYRLRYTELSREDAVSLIEQTREEVLELFPEKGDVFDLILRPRFLRFFSERVMAGWGMVDHVN